MVASSNEHKRPRRRGKRPGARHRGTGLDALLIVSQHRAVRVAGHGRRLVAAGSSVSPERRSRCDAKEASSRNRGSGTARQVLRCLAVSGSRKGRRSGSLTLRQIGDRMDLSGVRVRQLLNEFFGLRRPSRDTEGDPEKVKVPAGFIGLMREMVLREWEEGREVIVRALWLREAFEWQRLRGAEGVERRLVWWHLRQIGAFLASVGIADEGPTSRLIHAETVPLVRSGALGELACRERECEQASRTPVRGAAGRYDALAAPRRAPVA